MLEQRKVCEIMSKLCVKCGAPLEDAAMFCNICGAQQSAPQQPAYQQPVYQQPVQQPVYQQPVQQPVYQQPVQQPVYRQPAPKQPKPAIQLDDKKKKLLIGVGAAVGVILIVLLCILIFQPAGKGAVDTAYEVIFEGEADKIEDCLPEQVWEFYEDKLEKSVSDVETSYEKSYKSNNKEYKAIYGSDYKVDWEILETKDLEDSDVRKLANMLATNYGNKKYLKKDDIDDIKEVWIKVTIEGSKAKTAYVNHAAIIKIDGQWYLGYISKSEGKYTGIRFTF